MSTGEMDYACHKENYVRRNLHDLHSPAVGVRSLISRNFRGHSMN